jgi:hypothetical protein
MLLERKIIDFALDSSFGKISKKMKEHYNIDVPKSSCQKITQNHGKKITETFLMKPSNGKENCIIAECDGVMVPIVKMNDEKQDKRKTRKSEWKEVKLSLAKKQGSIDKIYLATIGSREKAGDQLKKCVKKIGLGNTTKIHFVGDGASWIAEQVERVFGTQATYLIDFYHLSEYLAEASEICSEKKKKWLTVQQEKMKNNKLKEVIKELEKHLPNDKEEKIKKCLRYMKNRTNKFDYKNAIENNLPIGSGKIESANKSIVQKRLKIPGAWWLTETVEYMLRLICLRENGDWENYWKNCYQKKLKDVA